MNKIDNGGTVFPGHRTEVIDGGAVIMHISDGMSLRDYFAGQALHFFDCDIKDISEMVEHCYKIADAMLKERNK